MAFIVDSKHPPKKHRHPFPLITPTLLIIVPVTSSANLGRQLVTFTGANDNLMVTDRPVMYAYLTVPSSV